MSGPVPGRVTRRARVSFSKDRDVKLHGSGMTNCEGDFEEATGIVWNPVRHATGVDPRDTREPIGIHVQSGAKIQYVPAEELAARATAQLTMVQAVAKMAAEVERRVAEGLDPQPGEVYPPESYAIQVKEPEDEEQPTGLEGLPEPAPAKWSAPPVKNEPVTPAAKRAAAEKAAKEAAKAAQPK